VTGEVTLAQDARDIKGTYLLLAQLGQEVRIEVGKLGTFTFAPGWYAYAGSALGPGGLPARLARHARSDKRLHWHVDYLLRHAALQAVWQAVDPGRLECAWAAAIRALPGAQTPVRGFGASDCRCPAHLVFLPERPSDAQIAAALSARSPPGAAVRRAAAG
jgi:Uri superfamily endonuclease